jgi:hypothetical protein
MILGFNLQSEVTFSRHDGLLRCPVLLNLHHSRFFANLTHPHYYHTYLIIQFHVHFIHLIPEYNRLSSPFLGLAHKQSDQQRAGFQLTQIIRNPFNSNSTLNLQVKKNMPAFTENANVVVNNVTATLSAIPHAQNDVREACCGNA